MINEIAVVNQDGSSNFLLTVQLSLREVEQLKDFAKAQGLSLSELAAQILRSECGNKLDERPE